MANEIFISYSSEDVEFVKKLHQSFKNYRIDPWIDYEDANKNESRAYSTKRGISNAQSFVFVISPDSLKNNNCLYEAKTAIELKKQLIPLFLKGESKDLFGIISKELPELGKINAIYFNNPSLSYDEAFKDVLQSIRGDYYLPNEVFISYRRTNKDFVIKLYNELKNNKIDAWVDWEDIPPSVDWQKKIDIGIENSHTMIVVISPEAIESVSCKLERDLAIKLNKRIIPIIYRDAQLNLLPNYIISFPQIDFRDETKFEQSFKELLHAVDKNLDYYRYYALLDGKIKQWLQKGKNEKLLLKGDEVAIANIWLERGRNMDILPTAIQSEFITLSHENYEGDKVMLLNGIAEYAKNLTEEGSDPLFCIKYVEKALNLFPDSYDLMEMLGYLYLLVYQMADAKKIFGQMLEQTPDRPLILALYAVTEIENDFEGTVNELIHVAKNVTKKSDAKELKSLLDDIKESYPDLVWPNKIIKVWDKL